ncbi:MAG: amidase family protein [Actinomycetota bacterium]|nr:amidase family protein [Actinomycetota bacterium]
MVDGNSMGTNWKGHYTTSLLDAYARGSITRADDLPETVKMTMLVGRYMQERYHGRYYAKAQNLSHKLSAAYDAALAEYDLLLLPTVPMKATPIPAPDAPREEVVPRALEMIHNTCALDVTGLPSMTVPCGDSEGLPVGARCLSAQTGARRRYCAPLGPSRARRRKRTPLPLVALWHNGVTDAERLRHRILKGVASPDF